MSMGEVRARAAPTHEHSYRNHGLRHLLHIHVLGSSAFFYKYHFKIDGAPLHGAKMNASYT